MNYYEFYGKRTGALVARGNARECRKQLGYSSMDVFYKSVSNMLRGKNSLYRVVKVSGGLSGYPVLGRLDPGYGKEDIDEPEVLHGLEPQN